MEKRAGSKQFLQVPSILHRKTSSRPTVSPTALQKKQSGKQQEELEVNPIWDFNGFWECTTCKRKINNIFSR